ncbi:MAG: sugar ABC transporter substrate-binding protein [Spirochaetia bacterium]|nr:sugar ABC transporter substrate-binding protein [Spirochaetia bacterium]
MKRVFTVLLITALIVSGSMAFAAGQSEAADDGTIVIGHTANNTGIDSYQTTHDTVFRDTVEATDGVEAIILDAKGDVAQQISQIETLIQRNVDVITVWPVNGKAVVPAVKKAFDAGIPVLIVNSLIDESGYQYVSGFAGPDTYAEGENAAKGMIEALSGNGKVVELMGLPGYVTAINRSGGFQDYVKANAPGIEILATEPADWNRAKATQVMENLIVKYGDAIDGVYVADDNIGIGALNALKEAGLAGEIVMTSACMFGEGYDAMEEGYIYGSVFQSPSEDAIKAVQTAIKLANGEEVPFWNYFDTPVVTPKNMDQYERPNF